MNHAARCINCQVLGMQKAVDLMLSISDKKAIELAQEINRYILTQENFKRDSAHLIDVRKDDNGKYYTLLTGKKHGTEGATKERLITLFTCYGRPPYATTYNKLGHAGERHKADLPALKELMKEGLVRIVHQDRKTITYQYFPTPKI